MAQVLIIADGDQHIGWGHLSRCRTLARALEKHQKDSVLFLSRRSDAAEDFLHGHKVFWNDGSLPAITPKWIVVDLLDFSSDVFPRLRTVYPHSSILLIEDHLVRTGADLRLAPYQQAHDKTLCGPEWALIDPVFAAAGRQNHPRQGTIACFGGADSKHLSAQLLENWNHGPLNLIASETLIARDELREKAGRCGATILTPMSSEILAQHLARAERFIGSASTIATEAIAAGTPTLCIEWIDNQAVLAAFLRQSGVTVTRSIAELLPRLNMAINQISIKGLGEGPDRLAEMLLGEVPFQGKDK